jgi:hypothetical protein
MSSESHCPFGGCSEIKNWKLRKLGDFVDFKQIALNRWEDLNAFAEEALHATALDFRVQA